MRQYLDLLADVYTNGVRRDDRTATGTLSLFARSMRFDLSDTFPLVTTKKVPFGAILGELLWFISGSTNIRPLVLQGIRIWNEWPYQKYTKSEDYQGESLEQFIAKIKDDPAFAARHGDLGPIYGRQWRDFGGVDQLLALERSLAEDPFSRRHILSAWNVPELPSMLLPPCHVFSQFYVDDNRRLSCHLYQRSGDMFLGVPFNIASYSLLTLMLAATLGYQPGEFVHTIGDCHIYLNHLEQVATQLTREPYPLPRIRLVRRGSLVEYRHQDFELLDYRHHPLLAGKVAV